MTYSRVEVATLPADTLQAKYDAEQAQKLPTLAARVGWMRWKGYSRESTAQLLGLTRSQVRGAVRAKPYVPKPERARLCAVMSRTAADYVRARAALYDLNPGQVLEHAVQLLMAEDDGVIG